MNPVRFGMIQIQTSKSLFAPVPTLAEKVFSQVKIYADNRTHHIDDTTRFKTMIRSDRSARPVILVHTQSKTHYKWGIWPSEVRHRLNILIDDTAIQPKNVASLLQGIAHVLQQSGETYTLNLKARQDAILEEIQHHQDSLRRFQQKFEQYYGS